MDLLDGYTGKGQRTRSNEANRPKGWNVQAVLGAGSWRDSFCIAYYALIYLYAKLNRFVRDIIIPVASAFCLSPWTEMIAKKRLIYVRNISYMH